jgi:hypothetical protein
MPLPIEEHATVGGARVVAGTGRDDSVVCFPQAADGRPAGAHAWPPSTYWLADSYALPGRHDERCRTFWGSSTSAMT